MKKTAVYLAILALVAFSANIWGTDIYMYDEVKNAQCAREMYLSGNYLVPYFNGELRVDKPPLHYFFMILSYQIFGFGAFGARIFSALFGVCTVLGTYFFSKKYLGETAALFAGAALVCSIQVATQFHMATPDPYLITLVSLALFSYYRGYEEKKFKWYLGAYVLLAFATLAKGPVALLLPGIIVLLFLFLEGELNVKNILSLKPVLAIVLILLIAAPWFLAVHFATDGEWTVGFFIKHNLQRYSDPMEGHGAPFFMSLVYVITGLLPLSVLLPQSLIFAFKERKQNSFVQLCLVTVTVFVGFFAFSGTILPSYPAPCLPFAAALIGYFIQQKKEAFAIKRLDIQISYWMIFLIALALPIAAYFGLKAESYLAETAYVGTYLVVFPIGAIAVLFLFYRSKIQQSLIALAITFFIGTAVIHFIAYPKIDKINPVAVCFPHIDKQVPVVAYKQMNPAFVIPVGAPLHQFENLSELKTFMKDEKRFYLISRKKYFDELEAVSGLKLVVSQHELFERPEATLYEFNQLHVEAGR
ncbi:MAG: hypothetical protein CMO01_12030 [Thalassobius sp.]|nr:hypothetical protein [Thalassovita sp.]